MEKLLATGKTDLLDGFVSNKTRRKFKAFLSWDAKAGKVGFEFEPRAAKAPAKTAGKTVAKTAGDAVEEAAEKPAAKKAAKKPAAKKSA